MSPRPRMPSTIFERRIQISGKPENWNELTPEQKRALHLMPGIFDLIRIPFLRNNVYGEEYCMSMEKHPTIL